MDLDVSTERENMMLAFFLHHYEGWYVKVPSLLLLLPSPFDWIWKHVRMNTIY